MSRHQFPSEPFPAGGFAKEAGLDPAAEDAEHEAVAEFRREFAGAIVGPDIDVIAAQMLDWARENGYYRRGLPGPKEKAGTPATTSANLELVKFLKPIFRLIWQKPSRVKLFALFYRLAPMFPWVADLYGGMTAAEFARWVCDEKNPERGYLRHTKQNVNKEIQLVERELREAGVVIPLRHDMRKPDSKEKMKQAKLNKKPNTRKS